MFRSKVLYTGVAAVLVCGYAYAQTGSPPVPPANSMKLSQIVAKVEQRDKFQYVKDIEWDEDGYYEVTYYTTDRAKVEIRLDPVSGEPK